MSEKVATVTSASKGVGGGAAAYEILLLDSMRAGATQFARRNEVAAEWRIITPMEEAWVQAPNFPNYTAGRPHALASMLELSVTFEFPMNPTSG